MSSMTKEWRALNDALADEQTEQHIHDLNFGYATDRVVELLAGAGFEITPVPEQPKGTWRIRGHQYELVGTDGQVRGWVRLNRDAINQSFTYSSSYMPDGRMLRLDQAKAQVESMLDRTGVGS